MRKHGALKEPISLLDVETGQAELPISDLYMTLPPPHDGAHDKDLVDQSQGCRYRSPPGSVGCSLHLWNFGNVKGQSSGRLPTKDNS